MNYKKIFKYKKYNHYFLYRLIINYFQIFTNNQKCVLYKTILEIQFHFNLIIFTFYILYQSNINVPILYVNLVIKNSYHNYHLMNLFLFYFLYYMKEILFLFLLLLKKFLKQFQLFLHYYNLLYGLIQYLIFYQKNVLQCQLHLCQ